MTLGLMLNKPLAKAVLDTRGIKTPAYVVVDRGKDLVAANRLAFPLIVKPAAEDASSASTTVRSCTTLPRLAERVRFVWREFSQPRSSRSSSPAAIQRLGFLPSPLRIRRARDRRDRL